MAELNCGGSVQICAIRVATLEIDGTPLPGPSNLYVTDAFASLVVTPNFTKGVDLEVVNACGAPQLLYKDMDRLKRWDLTLSLIYLDPEPEQLLIGAETFGTGGYSVGSGTPLTAAYGGYRYGVSLELWAKHIVNGDLDITYPYIRYVLPRSYWTHDKRSLDINAVPQDYVGYTSANPNWYNGPMNDWPYASDSQFMWAYTKTLPNPVCGGQPLVHS